MIRPPHAYIPGRTERHPEDFFDPLKDTVRTEMSSEALAESDAFRAGLCYLDEGFFWEAHEVWEAVWMALPDDAPEKRMVQALIQLANGRLKLAMGRPNAALRLAGIVTELCDGLSLSVVMGQEVAKVAASAMALRQDAEGAL